MGIRSLDFGALMENEGHEERMSMSPIHNSAVTCMLAMLILVTATQHPGEAQEASATTPTTKVEVGAVPTPQHIVEQMLTLANVKSTDVVYDLGCGDGRIVVTAAQKYGCRAVGFDIDPECVRDARLNAKAGGVDSLVEIKDQDIFELDLSQADVVTLYLLERLNARLLPQLEKMRPGSRIVSHDFAIPGVPADIEIQCYSRVHGMRDRIYMWTTPIKRVAEEDPADQDAELLSTANRRFLSTSIGKQLFVFFCVLIVAAVTLGVIQKVFKRKIVVRFESP